ncbi:hypothetical protein L2E82_51897 [Cichorium intybus]|nr:hypothetical protein L2E82_51897 [Cichorium intybus]
MTKSWFSLVLRLFGGIPIKPFFCINILTPENPPFRTSFFSFSLFGSAALLYMRLHIPPSSITCLCSRVSSSLLGFSDTPSLSSFHI